MRSLVTRRGVAATLVGLTALVGLVTAGRHQPVQAQARNAPATSAERVLLDPKDTLVLLLDHQTGLFQTLTSPS